MQCPRCKAPCKYLVKAYWKDREHPGFCPICCQEAGIRFDKEGWPPVPW